MGYQNSYLAINFTPTRPIMAIRSEADALVANALQINAPREAAGHYRIAEDMLYNWMFDDTGLLTGVELQTAGGKGMLEIWPGLADLPYVTDNLSQIIWFTNNREGAPREGVDFVGALYTSLQRNLIAVLATWSLRGDGEFERLESFCR